MVKSLTRKTKSNNKEQHKKSTSGRDGKITRQNHAISVEHKTRNVNINVQQNTETVKSAEEKGTVQKYEKLNKQSTKETQKTEERHEWIQKYHQYGKDKKRGTVSKQQLK